MQPLIAYSLCTAVTYRHRENGTRGQVRDSCKINLVPITEAWPPLNVEDFPGEFKLKTKATLRKRWTGHALGDLEVSMHEPCPIRIFADAESNRSEGQLRLTLSSSNMRSQQLRSLDWKCELRVQVCMKTFYSTLPMVEVAGDSLMQSNDSLRLRRKVIHSDIQTVYGLSWTSDPSPLIEGSVSSSTATIPFTIDIEDRPIPTFCGPFSARRYCVRVQVRIFGLRHSQFLLVSPLQICHCRKDEGALIQSTATLETTSGRIESQACLRSRLRELSVELEVSFARLDRVVHTSNTVTQPPPSYD